VGVLWGVVGRCGLFGGRCGVLWVLWAVFGHFRALSATFGHFWFFYQSVLKPSDNDLGLTRIKGVYAVRCFVPIRPTAMAVDMLSPT
jgi:hypothetical protein